VEEVHGRSQDVGRLKTALGWGICEIKVAATIQRGRVSGGQQDRG
jgi:hypothetical protein